MAEEVQAILDSVASLTMVPEAGVRFAIEAAKNIPDHVPGEIVECGVWNGGCSIAMMMAQNRPVQMLDSFAGLPQAQDCDGSAALSWQIAKDGDAYFNNCLASRRDLEEELCKRAIAGNRYGIWEGWFSDTLPVFQSRRVPIALLRLDCDWYASVRSCLDGLMPLVNDGAIVIVDDYYAWDGCTKAVHDFLSYNDLPYRVRSVPGFCGAYFVKE